MADRDLVDDAVNRIRIYFGELDPADESFLGLTIFDVLKEKNKEISDLREVIDTTREICGMAKIDWNKKPLQSSEKEPDVEDPLGKLKDAFKDYRASHDEIDELIRSVRERNFDDDEKEPDAE